MSAAFGTGGYYNARSWRRQIVPAGTPHQFVMERGESITYVTIKTQPAK